jgi:thioredoxin reductase (NADPH)
MSKIIHNVIIIGSGPAGYTAAIYCARANLSVLLLEGPIPGGQLMLTTEIENFPGFPDGINGYDLMESMKQQSIKYGCEVQGETAANIDFTTRPFKVTTNSTIYYGMAIILAMGATAKRLNLENEDKFWTKGISSCAVCDGALPMFRNKKIAVVGGGDSACEEALHLSKFGSKIYMIVRKNKLRASNIMQKRVLKHEKIKVLYNSEVVDVFGDKLLRGIKILDNITNDIKSKNIAGLFYGIGHTPNTGELLNELIDVDSNGYIITNNTKTNIDGVFAAGDVQDSIYRQAITAAGTGCMAALEAEKYLNQLH